MSLVIRVPRALRAGALGVRGVASVLMWGVIREAERAE